MSAYMTGWREIGATFGVRQGAVKEWANMGAPILLLGREPVTRLDDLWGWLMEHRKELENKKGEGPPGMSAAKAKQYIRTLYDDDIEEGDMQGKYELLAAIANERG